MVFLWDKLTLLWVEGVKMELGHFSRSGRHKELGGEGIFPAQKRPRGRPLMGHPLSTLCRSLPEPAPWRIRDGGISGLPHSRLPPSRNDDLSLVIQREDHPGIGASAQGAIGMVQIHHFHF